MLAIILAASVVILLLLIALIAVRRTRQRRNDVPVAATSPRLSPASPSSSSGTSGRSRSRRSSQSRAPPRTAAVDQYAAISLGPTVDDGYVSMPTLSASSTAEYVSMPTRTHGYGTLTDAAPPTGAVRGHEYGSPVPAARSHGYAGATPTYSTLDPSRRGTSSPADNYQTGDL
jgi:hypothetical protein